MSVSAVINDVAIDVLYVFSCRRKVEIMHTHSLFTLLGERLMMHTNTVSVTTYNTLYEVSDCLVDTLHSYGNMATVIPFN